MSTPDRWRWIETFVVGVLVSAFSGLSWWLYQVNNMIVGFSKDLVRIESREAEWRAEMQKLEEANNTQSQIITTNVEKLRNIELQLELERRMRK